MNDRRWTLDDLKVLTDPLDHIRRHPQMYLGAAQPSGAVLADCLKDDLVFLQAGPIDIAERDGWWVVSAGRDWLADETSRQRAFTRLCLFPERSVNDMHAEILLTAFASAVATRAAGDWQWIVAPDTPPALPRVAIPAGGRVVAFRCEA